MAVAAREPPGDLRLGVNGVTIEAAIDHLVDAAQGVVQNQLELARIDVQVTANRVLRGAALATVGIFLLAGAGVALAMAAYAIFPDSYPPEQRLTIIAGAAAILGTALVMLGIHRVRGHGRD
jgi:uncharacterized membrane protein YqjE